MKSAMYLLDDISNRMTVGKNLMNTNLNWPLNATDLLIF